MTNDLQAASRDLCMCSDLRLWVELRGFEPLTPSMRTRCATGLRYSPKTDASVANPRTTPRTRTPRPAPASPPTSRRQVCRSVRPSVADRADRRVRVLVVELIAEPGRDVDDLR